MVFTTRLDTIYGCTYCVIAPEHSIISELKSQIENLKEVEKYIENSKEKTDLDFIMRSPFSSNLCTSWNSTNPRETMRIGLPVADLSRWFKKKWNWWIGNVCFASLPWLQFDCNFKINSNQNEKRWKCDRPNCRIIHGIWSHYLYQLCQILYNMAYIRLWITKAFSTVWYVVNYSLRDKIQRNKKYLERLFLCNILYHHVDRH